MAAVAFTPSLVLPARTARATSVRVQRVAPSAAGLSLRTRRAVVSLGRRSLRCRAVLADRPPPSELDGVNLSGLDGRPILITEWPTKAQVIKAIPKDCFVKDTVKSMMYAAISVALTVGCGALAYMYIPMQLAYAPAWLAYAMANGTIATGCWVVAHECGHNAFSENKKLQEMVGYVLHTALLVPYFSWQRSHAVHHAKTNHLTEGETHVPYVAGEDKAVGSTARREKMGKGIYGSIRLFVHLFFGWPAYLIGGATGGPVRGKTNHFLPFMGDQGKHKLFPKPWDTKVYMSDIGIVATLAGLALWAAQTSVTQVALLYFAPYSFVNVWLVLYTWLQHTDTDIPHYDSENWNFVKGALATVDRPYGPILNFLHHGIGRTHVAHHVNSAIPHYNAWKATAALKEAFPEHYLYDPTPIHAAMWRVATKCIAVAPRGDRHVFAQ